MFEYLLREVQALAGETQISVPVELDAEGYLDRECPAKPCLFAFKVMDENWRTLVRDEAAFCPMCRHEAPSTQWCTRAQAEGLEQFVTNHFAGRLNRAMRADARDQNARQRPGSFLTITAEAKGPPDPPLNPIAASEPMRLRAACEACGCRYSYIGSAFFCPACGHNSAASTFGQSMENARRAASMR